MLECVSASSNHTFFFSSFSLFLSLSPSLACVLQAQAKQKAAKMDRLSLFHEDGHHFKTHSIKSFQEAWRKGKVDTLPSVVQMNTRSNPLIQFKFKSPEDTDASALGALIKFSDVSFSYAPLRSAAAQRDQSSATAPPLLRSMTLQVG